MPKKPAGRFRFILDGRVTVTEGEGAASRVEWDVEILEADEGATGKPIAYDENWPYTASGQTSFPNVPPEEARARALRVLALYLKDAPAFIVGEAVRFLADLDEQTGDESDGFSEADDTVDFHLEQTAGFLRDYFKLAKPQKRGARAQWTRAELSRAVREIARGLPPAERKYANVAERMRSLYPDRAPTSGDALRVLCDRLGVRVKALKRQGRKPSTAG